MKKFTNVIQFFKHEGTTVGVTSYISKRKLSLLYNNSFTCLGKRSVSCVD